MSKIDKQLALFNDGWRRIDTYYGEYAKSLGLSYTSLLVLDCIYKTQNSVCTQKSICETLYFPKQTVNSITTNFLNQKLIQMYELEDDRRTKGIVLTEEGLKHCTSIFERFDAAMLAAMEQIPEEQRDSLGKLMGMFADAFEKALDK